MNQHDDIRDLLSLAAAGALDAAEQRQVEEHLRQCAGCRAELEFWQRLTGSLEALPTPQAPVGLVERTRRQLEAKVSVQAERRSKRALLVWLTLLGWATTLLTWPLFQLFGSRLGGVLDLSPQGVTSAWIGYLVVSWMISALVAGMLGQRCQQEGRTL
jgi:anti-sigma factor RsiW